MFCSSAVLQFCGHAVAYEGQYPLQRVGGGHRNSTPYPRQRGTLSPDSLQPNSLKIQI
jgi:hypothetical protein